MTDLELDIFKRRGLCVLRLSAAEWEELRGTRNEGGKFTYTLSHEQARIGKAKTPIIISIHAGVEDGIHARPQLKLAWVKSIQAVSTLTSRISVDHVMPVTPGRLIDLAGDDLPSSLKAAAAKLGRAEAIFELGVPQFEKVSPALGLWLVNQLVAREENHEAIRRLTALVTTPKEFENGIALERDALKLALRAFGTPDAEADDLVLSTRATGLEGVRLREDAVIEHDARWIEGWTLDSNDLTGRATFTQDRDQLEVFTANKQPLEELFGVDLIYLNEARRSIVMVQYKMMEPLPRTSREVKSVWGFTRTVQDEPEWTVPIDAQFKDEMARMEQFDLPAVPGAAYRMNPSPFFFKLVKRNGSTNSAGILLSLGHLQQMSSQGQLTGSRGGLRISYKSLDGHYLRGETFVDLIRSGYIGSHGATTDHLEALIKITLEQGRGVVAAIRRVLPTYDQSDED